MGGREPFFNRLAAHVVADHLATFDGDDTLTAASGRHRWGTFHRSERILVLRDADGDAVSEHRLATVPQQAPGVEGRGWRLERFAFDLESGTVRLAHMLRDRVVIHSANGATVEHVHIPWGSIVGAAACFARDGAELWTALPHEPGDVQVRSGQLTRIDVSTGHEIVSYPLDDEWPEAYTFARHPNKDAAILDCGYGQDGTWLWTVSDVDGEVVVRRHNTNDRIMGGFAPDGERFVTAPHDTEDLTVLSWPDATELERVRAADIFEEEPEDWEPDWFYYQTAFANDRTLLAQTGFGHLLAISTQPDLAVAVVDLDGYPAGPAVEDEARYWDTGELETFIPVGPNTIATRHRSGRLDLWRINLL